VFFEYASFLYFFFIIFTLFPILYYHIYYTGRYVGRNIHGKDFTCGKYDLLSLEKNTIHTARLNSSTKFIFFLCEYFILFFLSTQKASICRRVLQRLITKSYCGSIFHYETINCTRHDSKNTNLGYSRSRTI